MLKAIWSLGGVVGNTLEVTDDRRLVVYNNSGQKTWDFQVDDLEVIFRGVPGGMGAPGKPARIVVRGQDHELRIAPTDGLRHLLDLITMRKRSKPSPQKPGVANDASFYGAKDVKTAAFLARINTEPAPELFGPFKTLRDAETALQDSGEPGAALFSRELDGGAREFFFATPLELARHLQSLPQEQRCWYEVVREGWACRLYLDVEYSKLLNPDLDGREMMQELLRLLIEFLSLSFSALSQTEVSYFIDLESKYAEKFSRHVIFPQVVLQDNVQMGHLLQGFREYVELRVAQFPGARMCLVKTDKTDAAFVCDMGVYGKNRNFRMAYCTKSGKNSPLVPVSAASAAFDLAVFQATLLCHFRGDCKVLTVENAAPARPREEARRFVSGSCVGSPFPKVDAFVRSLIEREGGFVRSALFFPASSRLTYSIGGRFRYCANVARNHKSNGVYFVVEIATQKLYQKCYDPDCRGFCSEGMTVPADCFATQEWSDADWLEAARQLDAP